MGLQVLLLEPSQVVLVVKKLPANAGDIRDTGSVPPGKIPRRRKRQLTPLLLPGETHGQSRLVGYSPRGHKELDTTEATQHTTRGRWYFP